MDELAKRSKQKTCRKVGIKCEPDEQMPNETGDISHGPTPPGSNGKDTPKRASANARKRHKPQTAAERLASDDSSVGSEGCEGIGAIPAMPGITNQCVIEGCLQILAGTPDSRVIHSEAIGILVEHRLPATAFEPFNDFIDTASWVANHRSMQDLDAPTVMRVVQALEKAEGERIASALLAKFKSPVIIQTVCERLKAYSETICSMDGDAVQPQSEFDPADSQAAASRQASLPLTPGEVHAEIYFPAPEAPSPEDQTSSPIATRLRRHASTTEARPSQSFPPAPVSRRRLKSMLPTIVDFVEVKREDNLWHIMLPVNTPELPIGGVTLQEIKHTCRTAFSWPISFVKAEQLGNGAWYAAFGQKASVSSHHSFEFVGKRLRIRNMHCTARYLPFEPPMLFTADVAVSAEISIEAVMDLLEPALSTHGVSMPTLFETMSEDQASRRLIAHFHVNPNLLYFCVPLPNDGSTTPTVVSFWPLDPSETDM